MTPEAFSYYNNWRERMMAFQELEWGYAPFALANEAFDKDAMLWTKVVDADLPCRPKNCSFKRHEPEHKKNKYARN